MTRCCVTRRMQFNSFKLIGIGLRWKSGGRCVDAGWIRNEPQQQCELMAIKFNWIKKNFLVWLNRFLQGAAGELETRLSRHVQTDVRHSVRAEQRSVHRPVPRPGGVLRARQTGPGGSHGSLLHRPLPAHVHRPQRPVQIRRQVIGADFLKKFIKISKGIFSEAIFSLQVRIYYQQAAVTWICQTVNCWSLRDFHSSLILLWFIRLFLSNWLNAICAPCPSPFPVLLFKSNVNWMNYPVRYLVCVNTHMKELKPFGDVPKKLSVQVKRSFVATRTFAQALITGRDVVNKIQSVNFHLLSGGLSD